jgi:hypothetical protein
MSLEHYNKILQNFLQSKVIFKCDNKILKTGKLKLFNVKQYFIKFYIETDKGESKILELPYPFSIDYTDTGRCTLNYKVSSLCNNTQPVIGKLKSCKINSSHKIYDNVVSLISLN